MGVELSHVDSQDKTKTTVVRRNFANEPKKIASFIH
jgi:hypothetical protein